MLTEAQQKVYSAVLSLSISMRRTPKYREIAAKVGLRSVAAIHKHIGSLIREGLLTRPSAHRLEIVPIKLRNGAEWRCCDRGHAKVLYQAPECPACVLKYRALGEAQ